MYRPSGDHIAFEGWRMSMSWSMVRLRRGCGCWARRAKAPRPSARTSATGMKDFITRQYKSNFPYGLRSGWKNAKKNRTVRDAFGRVPDTQEELRYVPTCG